VALLVDELALEVGEIGRRVVETLGEELGRMQRHLGLEARKASLSSIRAARTGVSAMTVAVLGMSRSTDISPNSAPSRLVRLTRMSPR
jgi:hypothetical protein